MLGRVGALLGCEQVVADVWCSTVRVQRAVCVQTWANVASCGFQVRAKINTHNLSQHFPKPELPCSLQSSNSHSRPKTLRSWMAAPAGCPTSTQSTPAAATCSRATQQAFGSQQLLLTAYQHKLNNKHSITTGQGSLLTCLAVSPFSFPSCGCQAWHCTD